MAEELPVPEAPETMEEAQALHDEVGHQDDDESLDFTDFGEDIIPEGTDAILFAQMLVDLRDAGFPEDPNDPDGSKLGQVQ